ncbi:MAG TPA: 3-deoxy-7-phosphoheptulonate synthase [Anaerolinea thermolimosa]|uniref:3-deoxy-7-phosphoheptulonate synthase n=1 Tax=Anaerolinea thermolimosa TaxID=229919 RepID=A0A3D1JFC0_9CHLR|nr:3-deoxy-7-phosphoheptulonate synthase [Anaerolinea thermolimosa]GAP08026.1 3-deoxy-D-arabinoheptulosonate-7-phosphate synthase [Anaerolinea thermolimosa]HCE17144.1 3-deoxy-7-phosphoheptulonate synthase [Anaerolinea thermolimosa]
MMIIMRADATQEEISAVVERVEANGLRAHLSRGEERTIIGAIGDGRPINRDQFLILPGVDRIVPISRPYKIASREFSPHNTVFPLDGVEIGGEGVVIIAGPCSVESREQTLEIAQAVKEAGAHALRGGAYKPRTSPYSFQGLGEKGLEILAEAREVTGLPIVTEVMSPELVPLVARYADVLQIGARNMQNYALLHAAGESMRPVVVKRGMSATVEELLMAAEYVLSHGNRRVILCERGIRTFETSTRNTTDINAVPVLKALSHLPVVLDPSHSTGNWEYVTAIARAAVAAGADGLMVEVHTHPDQALSDGGQSLKPERFAEMVRQVRAIARAIGRDVARSQHTQPVLQGAAP